MTHHSQYSWNS